METCIEWSMKTSGRRYVIERHLLEVTIVDDDCRLVQNVRWNASKSVGIF